MTKNKKSAYCYLPAKLAEAVAIFADAGSPRRLYEKARSRRVLPESPLLFIPRHLLKSFDSDLEKAKIPKQTEEGRLDFHALRVGAITLSVEAGANPKELQTMARHSDPKLTFGVYAKTRDPRMMELAERVGSVLPAVESATGVHFGGEGAGRANAKSLPGQALSLAENEKGLRGMIAAPG